MFEPTPHQQPVVDKLDAFLDGPPGFFVLSGYAGTGKTSLVADTLDRKSWLNTAYTALTHKAVGVLAARLPDSYATFSTIHRLLACKRQRDKGETKFLPDHNRSRWSNYEVIVVDEVSMVGTEIWGWLHDAQERWPRHIICMGDIAQLPPVNDGWRSPAFEHVHAELTEVLRFSGAIAQLAAAVRQSDTIVPVHPVPGEIDLMPFDEMLEDATAMFKAYGSAKVLAWRNDVVDLCNNLIRQKLFGHDVTVAPQPGELRIVVRTSSLPGDDKGVLHAEDELIIERATPVEMYGVQAWEIRAEGLDRPIFQVQPQDERRYWSALGNLRSACINKKRPWRDFYELEDAFVQLRPGYATTVHKAQGSGYGTTYVIDDDLKQSSEARMLRYVAFSRAEKRLVVVT